MRIFKNKWFARFARKESFPDESLYAAVKQIEMGNYDAHLGAGVFKQRIARLGEVQSGDIELSCASRQGSGYFSYTASQTHRANIAPDETREFKK